MMACSASVPSWWCRGRWFPISRNRGSLCFAALGGGDRANGSKRNEEDKEGWMKAPEAPKTDHYSVLGISRDASPSAVKVAFRKLARKYHPDVNNDCGAAEVFKRIHSAYETLSDTGSRYTYDQTLKMQAHAARKNITRNPRYSSMYERRAQQVYSRHDRYPEWGKRSSEGTWEFSPQWSSTEAYPKTSIEDESDSYMKQESSSSFVAREKSASEMLILFILVGFIWYTFGVQLASTYFAFFIPHNKDHTICYKFASLVAWLIGGVRGIILQYGIVTTGWLYGKDHDIVLAFLLSSLWIGINLPYAFHIPPGAILFMAYLSLGNKGSS